MKNKIMTESAAIEIEERKEELEETRCIKW
jgi:hypothetical protein